MLQFFITENIFFTCIVLSFASGVYPQNSSDVSEQPNGLRSCAASSYCIPIRLCPSFREGWNRRGVGITCGHGSGPYRRVCCPTEEVRHLRRFLAKSPKLTTDRVRNRDCGQSQGPLWINPYIAGMGGLNASEGTWPWMVAIRIRENSRIYTPWCTGFLIDRIHVLSAAHCFERIEDGLYSALIGSVDQKKAEKFPISKIKVHEGWTDGFHYDDIAVLTLAREVDVPNFMPICLPDDRIVSMDLDRRGTTLAGWGSEQWNGPLSRFLIQVIGIPVVSNQKCSRIYREELNSFRRQFPKGLTKGILCAGFREGGKDACGGDSGGPLMFQYENRWFAVGIVSFGYSCGVPGIPGGYTRVSTYLDWIKQNTKE